MNRYRDLGSFLFLTVAWAGTFVAIKAGLPSVPPVLFAALRFDVGGLVLLAFVAVTTERWRPRTRDDVVAIVVSGGLIVAASNVFLFLGQQYTTTAVAAVFYSLTPLLTTGFARLFLPDERLTAVGVVGLVLGLLGVAIIYRPDPSAVRAAGDVGTVLLVGAAASVGLGSVLLRRTHQSLPHVASSAWAMLLGAAGVHVVSFTIGERPAAVTWDPTAVGAILYLGVVATAVGYTLYFVLIERLGPVQVNLVSYAIPPVTAVMGWAILDESLASATAVGFLVILSGFAVLKRRELSDELDRLRTDARG